MMGRSTLAGSTWRTVLAALFTILLACAPSWVAAQQVPGGAATATASAGAGDYVLGPGDMIRVTVFQQPDLSLEVRIAESGVVSYPLIGNVTLGGLTGAQAEQLIATRLRRGNFLQEPQVSINITDYRSHQVSVLGAVNRPGRYPLRATGVRLTEMLAEAGGIVTGVGADTINLITQRNGQPVTMRIDLAAIFLAGDVSRDETLRSGDAIYVHRAPAYYIYGQVQRPGMYSVERGMTVAQAVAKAGGLTPRGTQNGLRLQRRDARGELQTLEPALEEPMRADDLVFVRESLF